VNLEADEVSVHSTVADTSSEFDTAWLSLLRQYEPAARVTSALLRLTDAGEHPVEFDRLAEAIA
jgi:hypothetical protein